MTELIMTASGSPFETQKSAQMRAGVLSKDGTEVEVVEVDGGFALKVIKKETRKRVPLTKRNVLKSNPPQGYVDRVVNDKLDNIKRMEDAGWFVVDGESMSDPRAGDASTIGSATSRVVTSNGVRGVLMRKRKDWYDEDYAKKMKVVDQSEEGLVQKAAQGRYGKIQLNNKTTDGELR